MQILAIGFPATVWLRARHLASLSLFLVYNMHVIPVWVFSICGYLLLVSPREVATKVVFTEMVTTCHTLAPGWRWAGDLPTRCQALCLC